MQRSLLTTSSPSALNSHAQVDLRQKARNASLNALTGGADSSPTSRASFGMDSYDPHAAPVDVGDTVEVPGGMTGVVRYVGGVKGKNGSFAGVELHRDFAPRGKNDGDVDGIKYFQTMIPGAGIFLPLHRAVKAPSTPTTPGFDAYESFAQNANTNRRTPPTPSMHKLSATVQPGRPNFSQSIGPGVGIRAPSPSLKKPRASLPRAGAESPVRRGPSTLGQTARPSSARPSFGNGARVSAGGAVPRAPSRTQSRQSNRSPEAPVTRLSGVGVNGTSARRLSQSQSQNQQNEQQQQQQQLEANAEVERLQACLDERDRQLKDQASSLAEMENSLGELQSLVAANAVTRSPPRSSSAEEPADVSQLRLQLREKNDKILMLTSEFDSHRADFRSTIDALEMASTETERVYEKRVQELLQEVSDLSERGNDVENVARQLKQLEDLVAELEDGLEDARRGEAEARSEVEFLRGEVERTRSELRRERDKSAKALKGATGAINDPSTPTNRSSRELMERDDQIRGLKAIIHSLSSGNDMNTPTPQKGDALSAAEKDEFLKMKDVVSNLQREKDELQGMVNRKTYREEELEREVSRLRTSEPGQSNRHLTTNGNSIDNGNKHGYNTSVTSVRTVLRPSSSSGARGSLEQGSLLSPASVTFHDASQDLQGSPSINDTASSVDQQYCDFCDSADHDILSCTSIGIAQKRASLAPNSDAFGRSNDFADVVRPLRVTKSTASLADKHRADAARQLEGQTSDASGAGSSNGVNNGVKLSSASLQAVSRPPAAPAAPPPPPSATSSNTTQVPSKLQLKDFADGKAVPGKSTGQVDMSKWCAMCEHEGHESIDCPFEDDY